MKRNLLLAIGLALVVIAVGVAGCSGYIVPDTQNGGSGIIFSQQNIGIWVTGEGSVTVVPDVAILSLGVEAQATTIAEAQRQAALAMDAIMTELEEHGIAQEDIKTQYYSIYQVRRWDNGKEVIIGYRVTNMVTVKIRDVDDTGVIIDAVAEAGGDYTRINSISFTVDNPSDYYEEAREKAMADAEAKAKQLADLAGVDLGKPTFISEGTISLPVPRDFFREAGAPVPAPAPITPISPGETEIRLTVQVAYSIESSK